MLECTFFVELGNTRLSQLVLQLQDQVENLIREL